MPRTSLTKVASALGVSAMTVSRAMRGAPGVSAELRERIKAMAKRMDYRPDPEIGRLMHRLRQDAKRRDHASIFAVTDFLEKDEPAYCQRLYAHAAVQAEELGFAFSIMRVAPRERGWASALRTLATRGVEGILLLPMITPVALPMEGWDAFSVVSATTSVMAPRFHEVAPNHAVNARLLCERLAGRGLRRLGLVELVPHAERTRESLPAALAWHHARHRVRCAPLFYELGEWPDVVAWARRERPEVIIVSHPPHFAKLRTLLERAGISVDWVLGNSRAFCDLAPGLDERDDLIGAAAITALSSLIIRGEKGIPSVATSMAISGQWVEATPES